MAEASAPPGASRLPRSKAPAYALLRQAASGAARFPARRWSPAEVVPAVALPVPQAWSAALPAAAAADCLHARPRTALFTRCSTGPRAVREVKRPKALDRVGFGRVAEKRSPQGAA